MSSCVDEIFFFQKKLNKYARLNEADKVLYYIHKLNHLNVTVSHLEETGVGKTVNALRHQGGKVGEKARGLVNKWKEMVTAEEEEEEEEDTAENEEEAQERAEVPTESKDGERKRTDDQDEEEEYEEDEEENCLQIEENENVVDDDFNEPEDEPQPQASPRNPYQSYGYSQHANSDSDPEEPGQYNPLTSQSDYQSNLAIATAEYHPTSGILTPRDDSSPEWGAPSPEPAKDWRNGSSAKKSSREEKDHSREREKRNKGKGRHKDRDRSGSHERERKKEKHRDKHRERDERKEEKWEEQKEEPEEERKSKSHKDKHRNREKHHARSKEDKHRSDDSGEKSKHERDDRSVVNGFNTPDHKDRGSKREKESERSAEERQRERVGETAESSSRESGHKENRAERTRESGKERHKESSRKEKHKREHRDRDESPGRHRKEKKNRHHTTEDESSSVSCASVNKESRVAERTEKEEKAKHKEEKRKHKDNSGKKDKHKRDVSSSREREEQESSGGDRSKREKKNSKQDTEMDSGFGAVLMGLDSPVKKKKKKKKKEVEKERESCSEDEQPSTSGGYKRGLTGDGGGLPDSKKPKLLSTSKDRLPALPSLDVMDEKPLLPEITPNYKPLPRLPVREEPPESGLAKMTEEEALNFVFQSKNNRRSKVYSGKVSGLAYAPSLYEICIRVLQENIDAIGYTGGVPFDILRPVLERASPKQLLNLEDYNPYLLEDSGVLWECHCKRDFKKEKLEEMETWREMWLRCSEERDIKLRNLTHNLTEKFLTKAEPKRTTKIAYIDTPAKVPKGVARAQAKYGTAAASALAAKPGKANEVAARKAAMQNVQRAERAANPRPVAAKKKKVAPLMAKTRQFFKKAFRR